MNQKEYVRLSLELHLFFDRIMKEHSLFLAAAFVEKDATLKKVANKFHKNFSNILEKMTILANKNVSSDFLNSNEIVTKDTMDAEEKTNSLLDVDIDTTITEKERYLKAGEMNVNAQLAQSIHYMNQKTLPLILGLIRFKEDILNQVLPCKMYTANYPLLITHITNEAKMYYHLLSKIENKEVLTSDDLLEQELFWNNIMKEHAEFIRGLLDPSEKELILTANQFSNEYAEILKNSSSDNFTNSSLQETIRFRDFKIAGEEGILSCKVKSIILPLLADHVVREANHFIRILKNYQARL